jgi:hypothetical protein
MFKQLSASLLAAAALAAATPAFAQAIPDSSYRLPPAELLDREATRRAAMRWEAAYVVLSAADLVMTVQCLEARKCTEANPLAKSHSTTKMIAIKSALTLGHVLFVRRLADRNPKAALRIAQVSVGLQGTVVGLNVKAVF